MTTIPIPHNVTVGVLALQGAFREHIIMLRQAASKLETKRDWMFKEVRTAPELDTCDALIIPGGESTAISLIAQRTNLLGSLRKFVKVLMKPTWGTCAGLILLAEAANKTKKGGQELIGGLDIQVDRNHFGRQVESFEAELDLSFLRRRDDKDSSSYLKPEQPFRAIFIRAPVVERILQKTTYVQGAIGSVDETTKNRQSNVITPRPVEILAKLPPRALTSVDEAKRTPDTEAEAIVAVKQANIFGTSFHPELTGDVRIHVWWLEQVLRMMDQKRSV